MPVADDTPIIKRTFQVHLWGLMPNHLTFLWSKDAANFCSDPQFLVVMPGDASGDFLSLVVRPIVEDMQLLDEMSADRELMLRDGTVLTWKLRLAKADAPMLGHLAGTSSSGGAFRKNALSVAHVNQLRDLNACLNARPRTLEGTDKFARRLMALPGFEKHIDVRGARLADVKGLLREFHLPVRKNELRPELEARAIEFVQGTVGLPHLLGGLPFGVVQGMKEVQLCYDYPLHGAKGLAAEFRRLIKQWLPKGLRETFTALEKETIGNKAYYTGADYSTWLAATPWMLDSLGGRLPKKVEHLKQAVACLAQANKHGLRSNYMAWWNEQPRLVMRFTSHMVMLYHHVIKAVPWNKTSKKKADQIETLWGCYLMYMMHAMLDIQVLPLISTACEREEQKNSPCRSIASQCSDKKVANAIKSIIERVQIEAIVKDEDGPATYANAESRKTLRDNFARSFPEGADEQRLRFGHAFWRDDPNWSFLIKLISYLLILPDRCWHIDGDEDDAELVLHCASDDAMPAALQLHFALPGGTSQALLPPHMRARTHTHAWGRGWWRAINQQSISNQSAINHHPDWTLLMSLIAYPWAFFMGQPD